ncbi:hypothetical protein SAMN05519104_6954 [Rhizobiales bacterium GAS188]|nr:hypothetical protein SAMN05519104_6954 [Rhizobiales bacterium GAS188]
MSEKSRVRTVPNWRAKAIARSLSDGFGSPAKRRASARSRSRLRILAGFGAAGSREIENS